MPKPDTRLTETPIPKRMRGLAKDSRGYPIPFIIQRDAAGCPHFAINDTYRVTRCLDEHRCAICGNRLDPVKWLVGGPLSAFHPNGAYIDSALHHECMTYALQVCPYLAAPRYKGDAVKTLDPTPFDPDMAFVDQTPAMFPDRPVLFVAVGTTRIHRVSNDSHAEAHDHSVPERPYVAVEYWRQGVLLDPVEGHALAIQALEAACRAS
jgi:hypothetical protein